jgi:hypothetical protein
MTHQPKNNLGLIDLFRFKERKKRNDDEVRELFITLKDYRVECKDSEAIQSLTARTLDNVVHLTEYEDQKANRILTAIAFLSALSGVLFASLIPKYQDGTILLIQHWNKSVLFYYISFAIYLLFLIVGATLVVFSLLPRFNNPASWKEGEKEPGSLLFFEKILEIRPSMWVDYYKQRSLDELREKYIKGNIAESYIVSQKIRDKLVALKPGVKSLNISVILLLLWLVSCFFMVYNSPIVVSSDSPSNVKIENALNQSIEALGISKKALSNVTELQGKNMAIEIASSQSRSSSNRAQSSQREAKNSELRAKNSENKAHLYFHKTKELYDKIEKSF